MQRPRVSGKFLYAGEKKLWVRGVSYGAFRPDAHANEYHNPEVIERDFAQMAACGLNAVRIPHTMPPRSLLDAAQQHGLRVMVSLSAEQYAGYLIDKKETPEIEGACLRRPPSPPLLCDRQRDPRPRCTLARPSPRGAVP